MSRRIQPDGWLHFWGRLQEIISVNPEGGNLLLAVYFKSGVDLDPQDAMPLTVECMNMLPDEVFGHFMTIRIVIIFRYVLSIVTPPVYELFRVRHTRFSTMRELFDANVH